MDKPENTFIIIIIIIAIIIIFAQLRKLTNTHIL